MNTNEVNFSVCGYPWNAQPVKTSSKLWKVLVVLVVFLWVSDFVVKDYWKRQAFQRQLQVIDLVKRTEEKMASGDPLYQSKAMKTAINNLYADQ